MEGITKQINIAQPTDIAFRRFVHELGNWWPREYSWSGEKLVQMTIDGRVDGLCTEIGPYDFRCDWGRIIEYTESKSLALKWQIGSNREPVPDPLKASDVVVKFNSLGDQLTQVVLTHWNFHHHGEDATRYQEAMAGSQGWDFILAGYQQYAEGSE